jgi:hypothetical protein
MIFREGGGSAWEHILFFLIFFYQVLGGFLARARCGVLHLFWGGYLMMNSK